MIRTIETDRLSIQPYDASWERSFVELNLEPDARRFVGGVLTESQAQALFQRLIEPGYPLGWAIVARSSPQEYLGHLFLVESEAEQELEPGIVLPREQWGQGIGTEAYRALCDYALSALGATRLVATVDLDNRGSQRVLEKSGFRFEGTYTDQEGPFYKYSRSREPRREKS